MTKLKYGEKGKKVKICLSDIKERTIKDKGIWHYTGTEKYITGCPLFSSTFWENFILVDDKGRNLYLVIEKASLRLSNGKVIAKRDGLKVTKN